MKVLVAEDDDGLREMLVRLFEHEGWEVVEARDGRDALLQYHKSIEQDQFFDAVVLDVGMPRLNGFAVGYNLRNLERFGDVRRAPHLYLTGHAELLPPEEELREGLVADAYLRKPFEAEELIAEIKKLTVKR